MPNGKCRVHGGTTPKGIASPHYRTGERSKYLPTRLIGRIEAALADPKLLDLRRDVALIEVRLSELLAQLDTGAGTWDELRVAYADLQHAMRQQDRPAITAALARIDTLITQGADEIATWEQIGLILEQRRRFIESENRRVVQAQLTMTSEQAMLLMDALLMAVKANVSDRGALSAIQTEFIRLTTHNVIDVSTDE